MDDTTTLEGYVMQQHESGLEFWQPTVANFAALKNKTCWGTLLNKPEFTDLDKLRAMVAELSTVRRVPVYADVNGEKVEVPGYKAILDNVTNQMYSVMTDAYIPINDAEVVAPIADVIQKYGLKPIGRFDGRNKGRTTGHIIMANPEFRIKLLEDYNDYVMLGVRTRNSFTGETGYGMEIFGVRTVCLNYNLWGDLISKQWLPHTVTDPNLDAMYTKTIEAALNSSEHLRDLMHTAREKAFKEVEVESILWGVGLPKTVIDHVSKDVYAYAPEVSTLGMNAYTLYNATTCAITYKTNTDGSQPSVQQYALNARKILTDSIDDLIQKGKQNKEQYFERLEKFKERMKKAAQMKVQARVVA